MDIEWVECPGGGEWSAATVTTILEVVDTFYLDGSRPVNQSPPAPPEGTIDSPAVSRAKQVTPASVAPTSVTETPRTKHRRLRRERRGLRVRR
jgi:hypothetical protein